MKAILINLSDHAIIFLIMSLIVNIILIYIVVTISKKTYMIRYKYLAFPPFAKVEGTFNEAKVVNLLNDKIKILEAENVALKKDKGNLSMISIMLLLLVLVGNIFKDNLETKVKEKIKN